MSFEKKSKKVDSWLRIYSVKDGDICHHVCFNPISTGTKQFCDIFKRGYNLALNPVSYTTALHNENNRDRN